jgi:hypothetical protein
MHNNNNNWNAVNSFNPSIQPLPILTPSPPSHASLQPSYNANQSKGMSTYTYMRNNQFHRVKEELTDQKIILSLHNTSTNTQVRRSDSIDNIHRFSSGHFLSHPPVNNPVLQPTTARATKLNTNQRALQYRKDVETRKAINERELFSEYGKEFSPSEVGIKLEENSQAVQPVKEGTEDIRSIEEIDLEQYRVPAMTQLNLPYIKRSIRRRDQRLLITPNKPTAANNSDLKYSPNEALSDRFNQTLDNTMVVISDANIVYHDNEMVDQELQQMLAADIKEPVVIEESAEENRMQQQFSVITGDVLKTVKVPEEMEFVAEIEPAIVIEDEEAVMVPQQFPLHKSSVIIPTSTISPVKPTQQVGFQQSAETIEATSSLQIDHNSIDQRAQNWKSAKLLQREEINHAPAGEQHAAPRAKEKAKPKSPGFLATSCEENAKTAFIETENLEAELPASNAAESSPKEEERTAKTPANAAIQAIAGGTNYSKTHFEAASEQSLSNTQLQQIGTPRFPIDIIDFSNSHNGIENTIDLPTEKSPVKIYGRHKRKAEIEQLESARLLRKMQQTGISIYEVLDMLRVSPPRKAKLWPELTDQAPSPLPSWLGVLRSNKFIQKLQQPMISM